MQHLISLYNDTVESFIKIIRIEEMIAVQLNMYADDDQFYTADTDLVSLKGVSCVR